MKKLIIILMLFMLATSIPAEAGIGQVFSSIRSHMEMHKRHRQFNKRKKQNIKRQMFIQSSKPVYKAKRHGSKRF